MEIKPKPADGLFLISKNRIIYFSYCIVQKLWDFLKISKTFFFLEFVRVIKIKRCSLKIRH